MGFPYYSSWRERKQRAKDDANKKKQQLELKLSTLDQNIVERRLEYTKLMNEMNQLQNRGAIHSTGITSKQGRLDKIRSQRIELEIKDNERSVIVRAKVIDGYYIEFKYQGKKQKKIIASAPVTFEYEFIPFVIWRRGLKYYMLAHEESTCTPFSTVPKLTQAKIALKVMRAISEAETWIEIAKATKGTDRKQVMMFLIVIGIISIIGILAAGDYFK